MRRLLCARTVGWSLVTLVLAGGLAAQEPIEATGEIELTDAEGDLDPMNTSGDPAPPLDVVKLTIRSDGSTLRFEATLAGSPGSFATSVVEAYIDADGDPSTGIAEFRGLPPGFDYKASVTLCMDYDNGTSCAGGLGKGVKARYGAMELERFEGDNPYGSKERITSALAFPGDRASEKTPLTGQVVVGQVAYADLGASSGDTIRIAARESGGSPREGDGYFPLVALTLK